MICAMLINPLTAMLGIRVLAQVLTTKIKDENKGTKIDNRQ